MTPFLAALFASTALTATHPPALPAANANAAVQQAPGAERIDLGNDLYMITGFGGNMLVSVGPDGAFLIDDQFEQSAAANIALIEDISSTPVVFVLNTHFHGDHTGGNQAFQSRGATILAHDNVRARLAEDGDALPKITFSDTTTFHWNGQEIFVFHIPGAHTDGDSLIHFRGANVIHTGDAMFSGLYPYIDIEAGGSVDGMITALSRVAELADDETQIVPGHGPVSSRTDVEATIDMLRQTRDLVKAQMVAGLSREDVVAADPLAAFNETFAWQFIDGDRMTGQLYDDLMAHGDHTDDMAGTPSETEVQEDASADGLANRLEQADAVATDEVEQARSRAADVIDDLTAAGAEAIEDIEGAVDEASDAVTDLELPQ